MRCALFSMRPTDLSQDWSLSKALMSAVHVACRFGDEACARSGVTTTAPMLMSEWLGRGAASPLPPPAALWGSEGVARSAGVLEASSYSAEVSAAPRYGHVLTTTVSRKGVPNMMLRHLACLRLGTSAVLRAQVHLMLVSTAKCPPQATSQRAYYVEEQAACQRRVGSRLR